MKIFTLVTVLFLVVLTGCASAPAPTSTGSSRILANATSTYRPYRPSGWTYVTTNMSDTNFYVDLSTIKVNGNIRTVWEKMNYAPSSFIGVLSARYLAHYDCANKTSKASYVTYFSGRDLTGKIVDAGPLVKGMTPVAPGTSGNTIWETVCGA